MLWRCENCNWIGPDEALLTAPSPFDSTIVLTACPKCKEIEDIVVNCDEPGCKRMAGCGWPTHGGGYRHTCSEHAVFVKLVDNGLR